MCMNRDASFSRKKLPPSTISPLKSREDAASLLRKIGRQRMPWSLRRLAVRLLRRRDP